MARLNGEMEYLPDSGGPTVLWPRRVELCNPVRRPGEGFGGKLKASDIASWTRSFCSGVFTGATNARSAIETGLPESGGYSWKKESRRCVVVPGLTLSYKTVLPEGDLSATALRSVRRKCTGASESVSSLMASL